MQANPRSSYAASDDADAFFEVRRRVYFYRLLPLEAPTQKGAPVYAEAHPDATLPFIELQYPSDINQHPPDDIKFGLDGEIGINVSAATLDGRNNYLGLWDWKTGDALTVSSTCSISSENTTDVIQACQSCMSDAHGRGLHFPSTGFDHLRNLTTCTRKEEAYSKG
jgi:hypothetical protein